MNPILASLNKGAAQGLAKGNLGGNLRIDTGSSGNNRFSEIMMRKNAEQMSSLQDFTAKTFDLQGMQQTPSISADAINLSVESPGEIRVHAVETDKNVLANYLSEVNGNMNQMDQVVDMVQSGTQLTQRDLIAIQIFVGKSAVATETFTRAGEQIGKFAQNVLNMQV
jgi:hypothetical protein